MTAKDSDNLGRLERVELRNVWLNEAGNLTPSLAQGEIQVADTEKIAEDFV